MTTLPLNLTESHVHGAQPRPCGSVEWLSPEGYAEWDAFVEQHPLGLVYHLSCWKNMLEEAFSHIRGRFLILRDNSSGKIRAGLPVYAVRSWLLGNRIVTVPFATFCDPLLSSTGEFGELLPHIQVMFRQDRCRTFSVRTRKTMPEFALALGTPESLYKHHYLPLDKSPEKLFASFAKSSICQKVNKAARAGVKVTEASGPETMQRCHAILASTRRRVSLPPFPKSFFGAMERALAPRYLKIFLAFHQGEAVACHLVLTFKRFWISEYSGSTDGSLNGANQVLYWETIRRAHAAGADTFSFGRTSTANESLLNYKRRWATLEEDAADFKIPLHGGKSSSRLPAATRENGFAYRSLRHIVKYAPGFAAQILGNFCYRHLG